MKWRCGVLNCGNGDCVHEVTEQLCPHCSNKLIRVKTTGYLFCSDVTTTYGCEYGVQPENVLKDRLSTTQ